MTTTCSQPLRVANLLELPSCTTMVKRARAEQSSEALEPSPPAMCDDKVVVRGCMMLKGEIMVLTVMRIAGAIFWPLHVCSQEACKLLAGQPKCYRPLANILIFKRMKQAILLARKAASVDEEVPKENLFGEDKSESPGKFDRSGYMKDCPILTIAMPVDDSRLDLGQVEIRVSNTVKEVTMELTMKNLEWLCNTVMREIAAAQHAGV